MRTDKETTFSTCIDILNGNIDIFESEINVILLWIFTLCVCSYLFYLLVVVLIISHLRLFFASKERKWYLDGCATCLGWFKIWNVLSFFCLIERASTNDGLDHSKVKKYFFRGIIIATILRSPKLRAAAISDSCLFSFWIDEIDVSWWKNWLSN